MCIGCTAPALAGTQPSAPNLPKEARAQPPLSFLAASFFSLKLKKSAEVPTMKFLLSLAGSKHYIFPRSGPCADGVHCSYGVGTWRAGAILQVHSTGYVHRPPEAILSNAVVSGGECEGEAGKKGRSRYESHRDRNTCWRC
jgi:hypothetical protein